MDILPDYLFWLGGLDCGDFAIGARVITRIMLLHLLLINLINHLYNPLLLLLSIHHNKGLPNKKLFLIILHRLAYLINPLLLPDILPMQLHNGHLIPLLMRLLLLLHNPLEHPLLFFILRDILNQQYIHNLTIPITLFKDSR